MELRIEIEHENDGRWLAEVVDLPGVMAYGPTREGALLAVKVLSLRVVADKLEQGEVGAEMAGLSFATIGMLV